MRPMFHFTERRIEAHICICFIAYKVYKELERLIAINKIGMSVDHVLDIAKTITTIRIRMPENGTFFTKTLFLTDKHRTIMSLFDLSKDQFKFGWRIDEVRTKNSETLDNEAFRSFAGGATRNCNF